MGTIGPLGEYLHRIAMPHYGPGRRSLPGIADASAALVCRRSCAGKLVCGLACPPKP